MISKVTSGTLTGLEAAPIQVETHIAKGMLLSFHIVGLPDTAVRESRDRVISSLRSTAFHFPHAHITTNLAPAHLKKEGSAFDLPIAVSLLAASHQLHPDQLDRFLIIGELSLDGKLRPVKGVISLAFLARKLKKQGILLPKENAADAALVPEINVIPLATLEETVQFLNGEIHIPPEPPPSSSPTPHPSTNLNEVKGQYHAKRALEIAAAGSHHALLIGPPGSGKTLIAKCFPSILPPLSQEEMLAVKHIHSMHLNRNPSRFDEPPFRSPHHTVSHAGLIGGKSKHYIGEITLAHHGVLFLDELGAFRRDSLDALRQPLEQGKITISRQQETIDYPARFLLLAATNPCPCGYFTDPKKACLCSPHQLRQFWSKLSGPLLDRIDLHIHMPRLSAEALTTQQAGEASSLVRARVDQARSIQRKRFPHRKLPWNSKLHHRELPQFAPVSKAGAELLSLTTEKLELSGRAYHSILKVARTIADLAESVTIEVTHLAEAIQYRPQNLDIMRTTLLS